MAKAKLTDSVSISEMMTLREQGLSMKAIADKLDVSINTVRKYIGASRKIANPTITPELKQRMFDLREQGMSNGEIADALSISDLTVRRHIGKQPNRSKVDARELQRLREQGMSQRELAEHFNVALSTISYQLKRLPAAPVASPQPAPSDPVPPPAPIPRVVSKIADKTVQEILVMSKNGMSCRKIAERVGVSFSSVAKILRDHAGDEPAAPVAEPQVQLRPVVSFREQLNAARAALNQPEQPQAEPPRASLEVVAEPEPLQNDLISPPPVRSQPVAAPYSHSWAEVETVYRLVGCSACYLANVTAQKVTITDRKEQLIARFTKGELVQYISELERVLWVLEGQQEGKEKQ